MRRAISVALGIALCCSTPVSAKDKSRPPLALDDLFQDHMIMPRHAAVVSGSAAPNENINISFFNVSQSATTDDKGRFRINLPDFEPGRTSTLTVSTDDGERVEVTDVLSGDVYLCSGQSNMGLPVDRALNNDIVKSNSANDTIRMATIATDPSPKPLAHFKTPVTWEKAAPDTVGKWSAACYFFGDALQKRVHVPIGLVNASLGGSNITTWLSSEALVPDYAAQENLLGVYADDPARAGLEFGHAFETWWQSGAAPGTPWAATADDLATWQPVPNPVVAWEKWPGAGLYTYDGPLWYATTVTLSDAQAAQGATLDLGQIDDIDQTWLNGQPVGFTSGGGVERHYKIEAGSLKSGDNIVVINVIDLWSFGGLYGDKPRQLRLADGTVLPLDSWRWAPVPEAQKYPPRAPWDPAGGVSILRNGMIEPMGPFAFAGAVWYQGESNVGNPYQGLLRALFRDWRDQFGQELAFAVVQLANNGPRPTHPVESGWARLREDQRLAVLADGNATLATAIDIGEPTDVHPANKQALGERLARAMAIRLYGFKGSESGPQIAGIKRDGEKLVLSFTGQEGDFVAYSAARPIGFEACHDKECRYVDAEISGRQVILTGAKDATKVRFCWADSPTCTLYDGKTGLPALPFEQTVAP